MNKVALIFGSLVASIIFYFGSGVAIASIIQCQDESCFIEQAANCNKNTSFLTPKIAGAQVRYSIMGPYKSGCDVRMSYTQHPDPEWVGLSVGFVIESDGFVKVPCLTRRPVLLKKHLTFSRSRLRPHPRLVVLMWWTTARPCTRCRKVESGVMSRAMVNGP